MRFLKLLTLSALTSILVLANVCFASTTVQHNQIQHHTQKTQQLVHPSINCCADFTHNQIEGILISSSKLEKKKTTHSNELKLGTPPIHFRLSITHPKKDAAHFSNNTITYSRSVLSTTVRRE